MSSEQSASCCHSHSCECNSGSPRTKKSLLLKDQPGRPLDLALRSLSGSYFSSTWEQKMEFPTGPQTTRAERQRGAATRSPSRPCFSLLDYSAVAEQQRRSFSD